MKYIHIAFALLIGTFLISCNDDEEDEKEYSSVAATKEVQNITLTTAVAPGYVSVGDVARNTIDFEMGIQYTLATDAGFEDAQKKSTSGYVQNFSVTLTDLLPQTSYVCRAYVFANGEYTYGQEVSFQTAKLQDVFTSSELSDTKTNSAIVLAKIDRKLLPTSSADLEHFTAGIAYARNKSFLKSSEDALKNASFCELVDGTSLPKSDVLSANLINLAADATYFYCTYVACNGIYFCGNIQGIDTPSGKGALNGHDWVDLGLSSGTCWATANMGASSPEAFGSYLAWGEISSKSSYTQESYASSFQDVATEAWGDGWQMPNKEQALELLDDCRWKYTKQNGVEGYLVTGPNNNSIFLPSAGYVDGKDASFSYSCYWTSTPGEDSGENAYYIGFRSSSFSLECDKRFVGQSVRPVCVKR